MCHNGFREEVCAVKGSGEGVIACQEEVGEKSPQLRKEPVCKALGAESWRGLGELRGSSMCL